jgi:succinate dehydrogenase / fumarate reductase cytochrome b subunit
VFGLAEIVRARPNNLRYAYFTNLEYALQRLSAIGLLLFVGAHVWLARISPAIDPANRFHHETWAGMHAALSEPDTFVVYVLGLLGVSYHLANGLRTAAMRMGLVVSRQAQRRMQVFSSVALVLLLAMSGAALYGFRPFLDVPAAWAIAR